VANDVFADALAATARRAEIEQVAPQTHGAVGAAMAAFMNDYADALKFAR